MLRPLGLKVGSEPDTHARMYPQHSTFFTPVFKGFFRSEFGISPRPAGKMIRKYR